jgi:hypothetical protein
MGVVLDSGKIFGNSFIGAIGNNLGLSWVGQVQSGRPYPVSTGSSEFGNGSRFFGAGSETQQRPNVLADGTISMAGIGTFDQFGPLFGPAAKTTCLNNGGDPAVCNAIVQNTFLAPAGHGSAGPADAITGDIVEFQFPNGNLERNAGRGSPFARFDASLHKTINIPHNENVKIELRFDAFNVFNHSNWGSFNSNDVLETMLLSTHVDPTGSFNIPNSDFFTCTGCQRPNGTFVGNGGQVLHIADLRRGKISKSLLPGQEIFNGLGDPAAVDVNGIGARKLQLSFHVRF